MKPESNKTETRGGVAVQRMVSLRLTQIEAMMLRNVVINGWGDGDFGLWIKDRQEVAACKRAMKKLDACVKAG